MEKNDRIYIENWHGKKTSQQKIVIFVPEIFTLDGTDCKLHLPNLSQKGKMWSFVSDLWLKKNPKKAALFFRKEGEELLLFSTPWETNMAGWKILLFFSSK